MKKCHPIVSVSPEKRRRMVAGSDPNNGIWEAVLTLAKNGNVAV